MNFTDKFLDPYRHQDYPDDVLVKFMPEELEPGVTLEAMWVRLREKINPHLFKGILLNQPLYETTPHHQYDEVLVLYLMMN